MLVKGVLSEKPRFVLFSSHTPGLSCQVAENILAQAFAPARVESGEMLLEGEGRPCPSGIYCRAVFGDGGRDKHAPAVSVAQERDPPV